MTLDVLASEISQKLVVRDRGNEFADDSMGLTVAATRYKIGAPEQGLPGVRSLMLKMVEGEEIKALAVINNMPPVRVTDVSADNFAQWHLSQEDAAKVMAELLNKPQAAPVVTVGASDSVELAKAGPLPLPTGDIAFCFAGLHWKTETEWKKPLGDKPKWLVACIVIPGVRGVSETRWNPVCIGAALVRAGHAKPNSVRAKFQTQPLLKLWLDEWKTYEADNYGSN